MSALQVTSGVNASFVGASRVNFRDSNGIPFVLVATSATTFQIRKGSGNVDVQSFNLVATYSSGTSIWGVSGAIDSNDVIHITWLDDQGKASPLMYTTFDTVSGSLTTAETVISDIGDDPLESLETAIAVNSQNQPHIVYNATPTSMGAYAYNTSYVNKVSGSWSSPIIIHSDITYYNSDFYIAFLPTDIPVITFSSISGSAFAYYALANLSNPTSFTLYIKEFYVQSHTVISSDSTIYSVLKDSITILLKHITSDPWSTWSEISLSSDARNYTSWAQLYPALGVLHLLRIDSRDTNLYHSTFDGTSWSSETFVESASSYSSDRHKLKWSSYNDRDSSGNSTSDPSELDYAYVDNNSPSNAWWNILPLVTGPVWTTVQSTKSYDEATSSWVNSVLKYHDGTNWVPAVLKTSE